MRPLHVVLNADDLGMSSAVNDAVFAALDGGLCTSATVLANGPAAPAALTGARARPGVGFGVHLCLTEFAPLTPGLAGLAGPDGALAGRDVHAWDHLLRASRPLVLAEWTEQVRRVVEAGVPIDHFDSHQHLHHRPALAPVLAALRERFGVVRLRGMGGLRVPGSGVLHHARAAAQGARALRFRTGLRRAGWITTDGFASVEVFLANAGRLPRWQTVELMAHPGNPASPGYAAELAALARGALDTLPFPVRRVRWSDIPAPQEVTVPFTTP